MTGCKTRLFSGMAKIAFLRVKWCQKQVFFKQFYPQLWKIGTKLFLIGKDGLYYKQEGLPFCMEPFAVLKQNPA